MPQPANQNSEIQALLTGWKLNKVVLASKIGMPTSTLKNKLNPNQTAYKFTDAEIDKLKEVLQDLSHDIEKVAGITFNH